MDKVPLSMFVGEAHVPNLPQMLQNGFFTEFKIPYGNNGHYLRQLRMPQGAQTDEGRQLFVNAGLFDEKGTLVELRAIADPGPGAEFSVDGQRQTTVYPICTKEGRVMNHTISTCPQDFRQNDPFHMSKLGNDCTTRARYFLKNIPVNEKLTGEIMTPATWTGKHKQEPLYLVGSGPSLEITAPMLEAVKTGRICAVNGALPLLSKYKKPDYFFTLDYLCKDHWFKDVDCSGIEAIMPLFVNPIASTQNWKKRWWYNAAGPEPAVRKLRDDHPEIIHYLIGLSSTYTALHWAWLSGFNPIILVGLDHCHKEDGCKHAGDKWGLLDLIKYKIAQKKGKVREILAYGTDNIQYRTTTDMLEQALMVSSMIHWLELDRVVLNCTGRGILRANAAPLGEVIQFIEEKAYANIQGNAGRVQAATA